MEQPFRLVSKPDNAFHHQTAPSIFEHDIDMVGASSLVLHRDLIAGAAPAFHSFAHDLDRKIPRTVRFPDDPYDIIRRSKVMSRLVDENVIHRSRSIRRDMAQADRPMIVLRSGQEKIPL